MKKNKTVTFQLKDEHENKLFKKAAKEHNFSGLMKRLYSDHLDKVEKERLQQKRGPQNQQTKQPQHLKMSGGGGIKLDLR